MSVAAIAAVVGAGTAIYGATQAGSGAAAQQSALGAAGKLINRNSVGSVPKPALFKPVDFNQEQLNSLFGNGDALPYINDLLKGVNTGQVKDQINQANRLIPGYSANMTRLGQSANDLISGRLPSDVVQSVTNADAERNNGINIPGTAAATTRKDLGLTSLDALNTGTGLLGNMVQMAGQISPASSRLTAFPFLQTPEQRVQDTTNQNVLIQQSQQNANNLAAAPDPVAAAQLHLALGQAAGAGAQGSAIGSGISSAGGSIAQLLGRLGSSSGSSSGGYNAAGFDSSGMSSTGFYQTPAAFNAAFNNAPGYTPVYGGSPGAYYFDTYNPISA